MEDMDTSEDFILFGSIPAPVRTDLGGAPAANTKGKAVLRDEDNARKGKDQKGGGITIVNDRE
ncbi:hypothetical protein SOVF_026130 [Spinacia oleracea]|nr:hypothetical protein SOVF_026130 [Spinacia oleracea]